MPQKSKNIKFITIIFSLLIAKIFSVTACYNSIPANPVWINSTLTSLHQLADLYVFTDYNAANIAPWNVNVSQPICCTDLQLRKYGVIFFINIQVDLHSVLTAMRTTTYSKDYEFQKGTDSTISLIYFPTSFSGAFSHYYQHFIIISYTYSY